MNTNLKDIWNFIFLKWDIIILILILLFGFILRIYGLGATPLWVDESISSLAAEKITQKGVPLFDSGIFYDRAIIFHYLLSPFVSIFHNDFGVRLISVLFGLGTILLSFFIGNSYNKQTGVIAALFTAVLFLEVAYSRQARFYQMFQLLFFLTIFLLYKSKNSNKYAWLTGISFLVLVDTHIAGIILAPLIFYIFLTEKNGWKDWKIYILPLITLVYYIPNVLSVSTGGSGLASRYIQNYSSNLYSYLGAFSFISLLGLPFAFKINKRLTLLLTIPSVVLIISVFFLKVFALRYVYFIVLLVPIFMGVLFSFIYSRSKFFFTILLIFAIIYPSNIFFPYTNFTAIKPEIILLDTVSEPVLDYKFLSVDTKTLIMNSNNVVLFTPYFNWYFKNPDYFIPFSLNGLESGYALYGQNDAYTGTPQFDFENPQIKEFVLVEDAFGYTKLTNERRQKYNLLRDRCRLIEKTKLAKVYLCNLA